MNEMTTIAHEKKLAFLDGIYRVYGEFIETQAIACRRFCADCCTCNVTLTTLEGYHIVSALSASRQAAMFDAFRKQSLPRGFRPKLSINQIAALCMADKEIPEESMNATGSCPLLFNRECTIYSVRPFACRCMVSKRPCPGSGYADMDELVLTVNNLILQYIEHIDRPGMTGNFRDVIGLLTSNGRRQTYVSGKIAAPIQPLILNSPIPVLMIPPRYRQRIQPILSALAGVLG